MITEKDEMYAKLVKMKRPKTPEGVVDIPNPSFFSIRPRDSLKTYFFGVPQNERALWIGYMNDAKDGMNRFREALRLKRGATASFSSSSAALMGNLQPIGSSPTMPALDTSMSGGSHNSSLSSQDAASVGSYTSLGPSSGRSFNSVQSGNSSNSARSNTANSDDRSRLTTIDSGTMPGSLAHHSASAPPARQFNIVVSNPGSPLTSITPRPKPLDEDPFGLVAHPQPTHVSTASSNPALVSSNDAIVSSPSSSSLISLSITSPQENSAALLLSPDTPDHLLPALSASGSSTQSYATAVGSPTSSAVPSASTSPAPGSVGTATLSAMPQPLIFSSSNVRDSFVFDSAM